MEQSCLNIEELLEQNEQFIILQARELMRRNRQVVHADVLDLEIDELIQCVRIKFWQVLKEGKQIEYSRAYIRRIVHSEFVDMLRRKKPQRSLPLPVDEEGELYQGNMLITSSEGMADPADVVEQQVEAEICVSEVVDAVIRLPERQQRVMVCSLRDRVDNLAQLEDAFEQQHKNVAMLLWPVEKSEKLLLQASLSSARLNVLKCIKDAFLYKKSISRVKRASALLPPAF